VKKAAYRMAERCTAVIGARADPLLPVTLCAAPAPAGERWDYDKGTSPGGEQPLSEQDAAIVRRLRTLCPDGRFDGHSNDALIRLPSRRRRPPTSAPAPPWPGAALSASTSSPPSGWRVRAWLYPVQVGRQPPLHVRQVMEPVAIEQLLVQVWR
jgi:hypothetical protein